MNPNSSRGDDPQPISVGARRINIVRYELCGTDAEPSIILLSPANTPQNDPTDDDPRCGDDPGIVFAENP